MLIVATAFVAAGESDAQTCTVYNVTVLRGEAAYTSHFLYRTPGGSAERLGVGTEDVGATATVTSSQSIEFGIFVVNTGAEIWTPQIDGQEIGSKITPTATTTTRASG